MDPVIHVQPGGEVVMTINLPDGRVFRVAGGREHRGCEVAEEIDKMIRWYHAGCR